MPVYINIYRIYQFNLIVNQTIKIVVIWKKLQKCGYKTRSDLLCYQTIAIKRISLLSLTPFIDWRLVWSYFIDNLDLDRNIIEYWLHDNSCVWYGHSKLTDWRERELVISKLWFRMFTYLVIITILTGIQSSFL